MQRILTDKHKNRLFLRFSKMTKDEMADEVIAVVNAVKELKPGFTCLTDLRGMAAPTEKEKRMARLVMEYLSMMGVSKVVRVGAKSIFDLLDQNSREVGSYSAQRAETIEEAETLLDEFTMRK
jgi:NADH:ubiquinone oxidoreductase subunit C